MAPGDSKLTSPSTSSTGSSVKQPLKRMTDKELADRRLKGLCFRCDSKFSPGHRCPNKSLQLLCLGSDEDEPDLEDQQLPPDSAVQEEEGEPPVTTLCSSAMVSLCPPNSLKVRGHINGREARRALRALKGLVRLQALVRGHAVRKQAAITLRCMQALVRVQAHVRARQVRLSLESQTEKQKFEQQLANEVRVREIEEGWCDRVGSVEEIQAKLLKRQNAAAKRERAMAYALAHQWQAGTRQSATPSGYEPDKSSWGWNWLERWMAVRPWENRFLDINLKDGVNLLENDSTEGKSATRSQLKYSIKKTLPSSVPPNLARQRIGPANSDDCGSSPGQSVGLSDPSNPQLPKPKSKAHVDDSFDKAHSRLPNGSRSHSNPKERFTQVNKQAKKRLSLPNNGSEQGIQTARNPRRANVKGTYASQNFVKDKTKLT